MRFTQRDTERDNAGNDRNQPPPSATAREIADRYQYARAHRQSLAGILKNARHLRHDIDQQADDDGGGDQRYQRGIYEWGQYFLLQGLPVFDRPSTRLTSSP